MFKTLMLTTALAAVPVSMANAGCVTEQVSNVHDAWVRGGHSLSGTALWKLSPGTQVTYCGRYAFDTRKDRIQWHWVTFKSTQEPWDHTGWVSNRILEPTNVMAQSNVQVAPQVIYKYCHNESAAITGPYTGRVVGYEDHQVCD